MKYGQHFETASVPEWSLHNIDYNGLKHFIKARTTRDQASAITIPGQQDASLMRFEGELYAELCSQHDRVGMFVLCKADEIRRRLHALTQKVDLLILRCTTRGRVSEKRQRLFAKYEREVSECSDDIRNLKRFVAAQVVAFRKISKKYKKWTGSSAMGSRFKDHVLSNPKSFTKCDFSSLASQCEEILAALQAASPPDTQPGSPSDAPATPSERPGSRRSPLRTASQLQLPPPARPVHYWNEYDDGSEAGDNDGSYVIYMNPDEGSNFPSMDKLRSFFTAPMGKVRKLLASPTGSRKPLLSTSGSTLTGSPHSYGTLEGSPFFQQSNSAAPSLSADQMTDSDGEEEDAFASDSEFPRGYETYFAALPSIEDQRIALYREKALFWGTIGSFILSLILLIVATILITTGRHRLRVEVDAGAIIGVVASLGSACTGLAMALARTERMGALNKAAVWLTFGVVCILNGMLLVTVMGNLDS